jgi:hypothetical protein
MRIHLRWNPTVDQAVAEVTMGGIDYRFFVWKDGIRKMRTGSWMPVVDFNRACRAVKAQFHLELERRIEDRKQLSLSLGAPAR